MLSNLFHIILYQPIFNIFVWLYNVIPGHDVGLVILVITALMRLALWPLTASSIRAQKSVQDLQPKIDEIKKKFADDKQKQSMELMNVYKENKVNPFASCLPLLIQLPILIALYMVMRDGLTTNDFSQVLYPFISNPGALNPISLGFIDMSKANYVLAILAGLAQFWQAKTMQSKQLKPKGDGSKDENMMSMMNKQMLYFMPVLTVIIGFQLPGGLTAYWFLSTLMTALQQKWMMRDDKNDLGNPKKPEAIEGKIEE